MFSSVDFFNGHQNALLVAAIAPLVLLIVVLLAPGVLRAAPDARTSSRVHALAAQIRGRAGARARRPDRVPPAAPRRDRGGRPAVGVGASVPVLLGAAGRARARQAAPASAPRRPSCSRSTSPRSCRPRRRTSACSRPPAPPCSTPAGTSARRRRRLRRDPPGGRGHDRDPDGHAGAAQGGHVVARGQAARDAHHAGQAAGAPELTRRAAARAAVHGALGARVRGRRPRPSPARRRRRALVHGAPVPRR